MQTDLRESQAHLSTLLAFASELIKAAPLSSRGGTDKFSHWLRGALVKLVPGSEAGVAWWDSSRSGLVG